MFIKSMELSEERMFVEEQKSKFKLKFLMWKTIYGSYQNTESIQLSFLDEEKELPYGKYILVLWYISIILYLAINNL